MPSDSSGPADIRDYALLSDCRTAALVSREGDVDWLCVPRFDSGSVFGALLGDQSHGRWRLRPTDENAEVERSYDGPTFTLVTRWTTASGVAEVHDLLPIAPHRTDVVRRIDLVRRIVGVSGMVAFRHDVRMRPDYARAVPWVRQHPDGDGHGVVAIAGPDGLILRGPALTADDHSHSGVVSVTAGGTADAVLTWFPSHRRPPQALDVDEAIAHTALWWREWADHARLRDVHDASVLRSLLILRALTDRDTGGIVAAATTSLPEQFGGARNWDYRYVWLRDAALTLQALIAHGYLHAVAQWRDWLVRAIAGDPAQMQIVYGLGGERDLFERELTSLPGYRGARPVRIGNGAERQYQADVIGEVLVALHAARDAGLTESEFSWPLERALLRHAATRLDEPDQGIWEIRGEPRMFTHSRVMLWAGFDRGVRAIREYGLEGPLDEWERTRDALRAEIDAHAVAPGGHFTQTYGSDEVDASLLLLPTVDYCAPTDPRMLATVDRIEQTLLEGGFVQRYRTASGVDGLAGGENPFLACSFWLVQQYAASGRLEDAERLFDRLCALVNDVGMLSEEYDPAGRRHAGNTPQALSHLTLVGAADAVHRARAAEATRAAHG